MPLEPLALTFAERPQRATLRRGSSERRPGSALHCIAGASAQATAYSAIPRVGVELLPNPSEQRGGVLLERLQKLGGRPGAGGSFGDTGGIRPHSARCGGAGAFAGASAGDRRAGTPAPLSARAASPGRRASSALGVAATALAANKRTRRLEELCGTWCDPAGSDDSPSPTSRAASPASPREGRRGSFFVNEDLEVEEIYKKVFDAIQGRGLEDTTGIPLHATPLEGHVPIDGSEYYVVTLPPRPCVIKVHLERLSGSLPILYGSTQVRPDAKRYDFKSTNGEFLCRHLCGLAPDEVETAVLSAPKTLHLSVVSSSGAVCEFRIRCAVRREEKDANNLKQRHAKNRVEEKLHHLRSDPHERRAFEERVHQHQCEKAIAQARALRLMEKKHREQMRPESSASVRERRREKHDLVTQRREEAEREREERMQYWVGRVEQRQRERELLLEQEALEAARVRRQELWLPMLVVNMYAHRLLHQAKDEIAYRKDIDRKVEACSKLQRCIVRGLVRHRRRDLYRNVIIFRAGLMAYARNTRLLMLNVAHSRLVWFFNGPGGIQKEGSAVRSLSFHMALKRYLAKIRLLQRCYRKKKAATAARVEALQIHFTAEALVRAYRLKNGQPIDGLQRRPSNAGRGNAKAEKQQQQQQQQQNNGRRRSMPGQRDVLLDGGTDIAAPTFVRLYAKEEMVPQWLRSYALKKHVRYMEKSYMDRVAEFRKGKDEVGLEMLHELAKMGLATAAQLDDLKKVRRKPCIIEYERLEELYEATFTKYLAGGYRYLVHDRNRLTKKYFYKWRYKETAVGQRLSRTNTLARSGTQAVDAPAEGKKRSSTLARSFTRSGDEQREASRQNSKRLSKQATTRDRLERGQTCTSSSLRRSLGGDLMACGE